MLRSDVSPRFARTGKHILLVFGIILAAGMLLGMKAPGAQAGFAD
jgi:hypothetical protein